VQAKKTRLLVPARSRVEMIGHTLRAARISRSGTQNHSIRWRQARRNAVTACAPTFFGEHCALYASDDGGIARDDLGDLETGAVEGHGQKAARLAGSDDGNGGFLGGFSSGVAFAFGHSVLL
jgi:hypothetical protein